MPSRSLKLSPDLDEAIERRAKALGYPSLSAYLKGLARYDLLCQGPHTMTQPWASLPLAEQDKIDADDELDHIFAAITRKAGWRP